MMEFVRGPLRSPWPRASPSQEASPPIRSPHLGGGRLDAVNPSPHTVRGADGLGFKCHIRENPSPHTVGRPTQSG